MTARGKLQRGQATVELAVMSVMFVAVLLFGIYFGEVGFLTLKVQEAANFAVLESTAMRVHDFKNGNLTGNFNQAYGYASTLNGLKGAEKTAQDRYQDYDGVENSPQFQQVMTRGQKIKVACSAEPSVSFKVANAPSTRPFMAGVRQYLNRLYRDTGGQKCSARATVEAINFPKSFLEGGEGGLAKSKLFDSQPLLICGVGRPVGGSCKGEYAVLNGDWSFNSVTSSDTNNDTPQDSNGTPIPAVNNPGYRKLVNALYTLNGDSRQTQGGGLTRAQELMLYGGGFTKAEVTQGYNDRKFYMSFSGEEHGYVDAVPSGVKYNTSGVYFAKYPTPNKKPPKKTKCFLGLNREGCS